MSLHAEIATLRGHLDELVGQAEPGLVRRYALRALPGERPSPYRRLRRAAGGILRRFGLRAAPVPEPWLPGLKHVERSGTRPFLIWALGADRDTLRAACAGFQALSSGLPGWAPVLVTDVADFAFFSRLGWLVEFVPAMSEPARGYADQKRRYLAWRYRDAPAVPVSAGLTDDGIGLVHAEIARMATA